MLIYSRSNCGWNGRNGSSISGGFICLHCLINRYVTWNVTLSYVNLFVKLVFLMVLHLKLMLMAIVISSLTVVINNQLNVYVIYFLTPWIFTRSHNIWLSTINYKNPTWKIYIKNLYSLKMLRNKFGFIKFISRNFRKNSF